MTHENNNKLEWRISDTLIEYPDALREMEARVAAIRRGTAPELVWLLEHPPLYTAGTSANPTDLVEPERFPVYDAGRGGQYTYHGPGQRVVYFMLDLKKRGKDVRKFIYGLEKVMIQSLAKFNVKAERRQGRVGVWVERSTSKGCQAATREDKIGAIGVRIRQWVTFHGISINVEPDLTHFEGIVPCGIAEHGVTSLADLGLPVTMHDLDVVIRETFEDIFGLDQHPMSFTVTQDGTKEPETVADTKTATSIEKTHPVFRLS